MDDNLRTQLRFESAKKSTGVSYLLWFFLGWAVLGVWWLIDAFLIPQMIEQENARLIEELDRPDRLARR